MVIYEPSLSRMESSTAFAAEMLYKLLGQNKWLNSGDMSRKAPNRMHADFIIVLESVP